MVAIAIKFKMIEIMCSRNLAESREIGRSIFEEKDQLE